MQDFKEYDEQQAVAFIRNYVGSGISREFTDDEILYVVDCIWDYYEQKGLTDLSDDLSDEEEIDTADLVSYVSKALKKDNVLVMDTNDINLIVKAELAYEQTLEDFDA